MERSAPVTEPSHAALEQAAEWYACLRDGRAGAAERAAWSHWRDAAEEHATAWRYVEEISRTFEPVQTLSNARTTADQLTAAHDRLRSRRRLLAGVALLASGGFAGMLAWRQTGLPGELLAWGADHRTRVGEQRTITLADGSRLWLNTATAIDVRFTADTRRIVLHTGEIFLQTARDAARPLVVDTPQGRMRALGTRFNVRLDGPRTQLAVYEGAVEIRTADSGATAVVAAGRQAGFTAAQIEPAAAADLAREAWTQGTLVADNIPLGEVLRELRRYRRGHLGVADEVAGLTVYGNLPIHDTDRVLAMLASALPIRIAQPLPWWTSIEARR
ncbi:FecR domain-containing protein [Acidovorax sp. CCYZU-2555]|uniref:FecR family protein n=1 Tax=Acidovorax sp. CCYZU-2555 TaxID=2835042 RepID=UPI001BCBE753|nr:FecR domain-containing protein [Acidovorax sp. CCYZU-2555]MBS7777567.1 FecR domain-containing protein [Acidovorax sp. CCYZU-2555]